MIQNLVLRKIEQRDMDILFKWVNDSDDRKNSFQSEPIEYEAHRKWFFQKLNDANCKMYMCTCNNEEVGQVRLEIVNYTGIISYSISKEHRGKGYGYILLRLLEEEMQKTDLIKFLEGKVKYDNIASQKAFVKAGYIPENQEEFIVYRKAI